jgi:hypothetical protein
MTAFIGRLSSSVLLALITACLAPIARADTVIRQEIRYSWNQGSEAASVTEQTYRIGTDRARIDLGDVTHVVNTKSGEFFHIDRDDRTYYAMPSPYSPFAMIPEAFHDQAREQLAMLAPRTLHVEETGETDRIAGYEVRRVRIEAGGPGEPFTTRMDLWVSADLWAELEGTAYWALEQDRLRENQRSAWLVDVLAGLEAVPLKSESWIESRGGKDRSEYVRVTTAIEKDVEVPDEQYRVPEGYRKLEAGLRSGG